MISNVRQEFGKQGFLFMDKRKTVVCEEKKIRHVLENNSKKTVFKYRVDNQLITDGERCDYCVGVCDNDTLYFIELKSDSVRKAASQIHKTLNQLENAIRRLPANCINARIITKGDIRPKIYSSTTEYRKMMAEIGKYRGTSKVRTRELIEKVQT